MTGEKAASEFLFRQSGLSFEMNRNVVSVDGEFTRIDYGFGNAGRKRTLLVDWPDGTQDRIVVDSNLTNGWTDGSRVKVKDFSAGAPSFHKNLVKVSIDGGGAAAGGEGDRPLFLLRDLSFRNRQR